MTGHTGLENTIGNKEEKLGLISIFFLPFFLFNGKLDNFLLIVFLEVFLRIICLFPSMCVEERDGRAEKYHFVLLLRK